MNGSVAEEQKIAEVTSTSQTPKPVRKASQKPHKAKVRPSEAKPARKATHVHQSAKGPKAIDAEGRPGSKTAKIVGLLRRPKGATLSELMKATGWQAHSVRGFLSGTLGKRMGLAVTSTKGDDGERRYSLPR
jgi:cell division septation protein DedD